MVPALALMSRTCWAALQPVEPLEEARERIAFSLPLHIESLRAHGEPVPPPTAVAEQVTVAP